MRKSLALLTAVTLTGGAFAADNTANFNAIRDNVGVGLGTMLWSNVGSGLIPQICAATTNGSSGNQTFAVSTGTSQAKKWNDIVGAKDLNDYIKGNMDGVARDAAAGRGESLDTIAELLAVPAEKRSAFAARLQAELPQVMTGTLNDDALTERVIAVAQSI